MTAPCASPGNPHTTVPSRYSVPASALTTHLVEDRRATLSPWGRGSSKLGPGVYTYSKLPVKTCPGASRACLEHCYARKLARIPNHPVWNLWESNTERGYYLPPLPDDAKLVRIHVSGDFDTVPYIDAWADLAEARPDVTFWGYTRSWRVFELLTALTGLWGSPNVHLWASMDESIDELPPSHWRRAWIEGDKRLTKLTELTYRTFDGRRAVVCPEATGMLPNCESCKLCWLPQKYDLVFPLH